jgi:peptide chain release factor subunit 3
MNIPYLRDFEEELRVNIEAPKIIKPKVEKVELIEEEVKKFKPIVWSPEETIDIQSIKANMNEEKVKVFDETKEPLVMIFIGHVDSGKSTICGSILQLAGIVNELEVTKLRQEAKGKGMESWYNAYVMDVIDEEKESGKTIEMGRAYFETKSKRFTILDCPGHKNFVQSMLGGAAQADIASLVISAKMGEFESGFEKEGQTREHAMLARSLGARYIVVLINKMDIVNWSVDRFNYIKTNLTPFLEINCGFSPNNIFWTILSGLHQLNMNVKINESIAPWFSGESLFETFDSLPSVKHSQNKMLRIPLLDKFKDMGVIISSCKINSGVVKPNMTCVLMPLQKTIIISKVLDTMDSELAYAGTGESVTLHLKGIEEDEIRRGYVICGQQFWTNVCFEFEAEVTVFELLPVHCFGPGFTCMIHLHTALEEVTITHLSRIEEIEGKQKKSHAIALKSGQKGIVKFKTKNMLCLEKYCDFEDLGRFALRKETITMAAGTILRFKPINPELLKNNSYFGVKVENIDTAEKNDIC